MPPSGPPLASETLVDVPLFADRLFEPKNPGEGLLTAEEWLAIAGRFRLSTREMCVAILIFQCKSRFQMARELGCAPGTLRVYVDRLYEKLRVHDRVGLVLRVIRAHQLLGATS